MKYAKGIIFIIEINIFSSSAWWFFDPVYHPPGIYDHMTGVERNKLSDLMNELITDIKHKVRQLDDIQSEHSKYTSFGIGFIFGMIREKYTYVMERYRQMDNQERKLNKNFGPAMNWYRRENFIILLYFEWIHIYEVDIDHLVDIVIQIEQDSDSSDDDDTSMLLTKGTKKTKTRQADEILRAREEQFKSRQREKYVLKKMGLPTNSTTPSKRFENRWPVEETWTMPQY